MNRISQKILWLVETIVAIMVIAMVALTFADVIGRRIFGAPIYGANDITEHLMALIVFAGLPIVTARGLHLSVDLFCKFLDHPTMRWWKMMTEISVGVILAVVAWVFFNHAENAQTIREVSQALNVPRAPLYVYMAYSAALSSVLAFVAAIMGSFGATKHEKTEDVL
jgi:TRAP-type C4-dicarboxylate transport system permease small subunit